MKNKSAKKALTITGNVLLWIFVAFCALTMILALTSAASSSGLPSIFGKSLVTVQSESMAKKGDKDAFFKGDLIIVTPLSGTDRMYLKEGDIVTFYYDVDGDGQKDEFNTHKIIAVAGDPEATVVQYTTHGINNPDGVNETVVYSDVVGVWKGTRIGGLGAVLDFLQSSTGFLIIVVLPMALFFAYEIYNMVKVVRTVRPKKAVAAVDEEEIKRQAVEEYLRQLKESGADLSALPPLPDSGATDKTGDGDTPADMPADMPADGTAEDKADEAENETKR